MGHWGGSLVAFTALVVFQWGIEAERFVAFRDWLKSIAGGGGVRSGEEVGHEVFSLIRGGHAIFRYP